MRKRKKSPFWTQKWPVLPNFRQTRIFAKNPTLSLLHPYGPLTSCKKSEKTNEPIPGTECYGRRTDGQTDGQKDERTNPNS